jgi:hypothetical protein
MTADGTAVLPRCGARTRAAGGRACRLVAGHGTPARGIVGARCKFHTGSTRSNLAYVEKAAAVRALSRLGQPIPTDPLLGLQQAVDSAAGLHAALQQLVSEAAETEDTRALLARLALYSDAIDRLARTAKQAVEARLTDRLRAQTEQEAHAIFDAVMAALTRLGLSPEQVKSARPLLRDEFLKRFTQGETKPR